MTRYFLKRIALIPILILAVSAIIFFLVNLSKVDPAYAILGATAKAEQVEAFHEKYGLNDPAYIQYFNYLKQIILHGNFGTSFSTNNSVISEIARVLPPTIRLAVIGFSLSILIGIPLGVLCAVKQYSAVDNTISFIAMFMSAVPAFLIAILLMLVFTVFLGWLPAYGLNTLKSYILPILTLLLPSLTIFIRFTRSAMLDTIRQDYIRTSRSKGNTERVVIFRDALRNAMLPIAAFVGDLFAGILGSTIVVEQIYSIPGLGAMIISSINRKDTPMIVGCVLLLSVFYIAVTILVDFAFTLIDPRVKASFASKKRIRRKDLYDLASIFAEEEREEENFLCDTAKTLEGGEPDHAV